MPHIVKSSDVYCCKESQYKVSKHICTRSHTHTPHTQTLWIITLFWKKALSQCGRFEKREWKGSNVCKPWIATRADSRSPSIPNALTFDTPDSWREDWNRIEDTLAHKSLLLQAILSDSSQSLLNRLTLRATKQKRIQNGVQHVQVVSPTSGSHTEGPKVSSRPLQFPTTAFVSYPQ